MTITTTTVQITPEALDLLRRSFPGPLVLDVRREAAYAGASHALPGALRRDPERLAEWADGLELARPVVAYCVHGHEVSQGAAAALRARGVDARFLEGGIEGWAATGRPLATKPQTTLWVTRERPKIDRIACPWLIRRFVDPDARFLYVPTADVAKVAAETGAEPFDVPDVRLTHRGQGCSFDAFLADYGLADPGLGHLALIVRGADTSRLDLAPEAAGLFAVSLGLSANIADDHQMLCHGLVLYDALYRWLRDLQAETHSWPPARAA